MFQISKLVVCAFTCAAHKRHCVYYNTLLSWISILDLAKKAILYVLPLRFVALCYNTFWICTCICTAPINEFMGCHEENIICHSVNFILFKAYNNIQHRILCLPENHAKSSVYPTTRYNIPKDTSLQHHC
jgi:hypothetical protein